MSSPEASDPAAEPSDVLSEDSWRSALDQQRQPPEDARASLLRLAKKAPALDLTTADIVFLGALTLRSESANTSSFSEGELLETFREALAITDPLAENARKRGTHSIARLREQRLLVRIDGAGVLRAGEYAQSRLATAIVQFFLEDEALTAESLSILTHSLISSLGGLVRAAQAATSADEVARAVVGPLRIAVSDLAEGIARRQRALDLRQEEFQRTLAGLLSSDWFSAMERCESLVESAGRTLRELNEVLLRDTHRMQEALQELRDLCREAGAAEAEVAVERVTEQVDRIAEWGSARQRAWSEYHQYVHAFLRDVVRLDPSRALTERLRNQLGGREGRAFALTVAAEPSIVLLREDAVLEKKPPVVRPKKEREKEPVVDVGADASAELERLVRHALDDGASGLADVTERVARELPEAERYVSAGRIAELVARLGRTERRYERPWLPIADAFLIEEWPVERARGEE